MFKFLSKEKKRNLVMPKHLTKAEKKEVRQIINKAQKNDGVPKTAQQSIPFDRMFQDGICRIGQDYYTKTIQFQDINYQLAQQEDKTEIFEEWCSFLNFFDSSVHFELSFMNMATDIDDFRSSIAIPHQNDGFNGVRDEYSTMLFRQMEAGNNGLTKTKFLTFGIHADSMKSAKPRIIHIETDILNNFKRLGVQAKVLNGKERLALMHQQFHMGDMDKFIFDWKYLTKTGLTVKDFIAPSSFAFPNGKRFQMLYVLMEGELFPMVLSLPTGSLKEFTKYLKRQLSKGRKLNQIVTKISLKKATNGSGIAFSQAVFSFERVLNDEERAAVAVVTDSVKAYAANLTMSALAEGNEDVPFVDAETGEVIEPLKK